MDDNKIVIENYLRHSYTVNNDHHLIIIERKDEKPLRVYLKNPPKDVISGFSFNYTLEKLTPDEK